MLNETNSADGMPPSIGCSKKTRAAQIDALVIEIKSLASSVNDATRELADKLSALRGHGLTQSEIANRVGKKQAWVSTMLRWCDGGFATETPFGEISKAARSRKTNYQATDKRAKAKSKAKAKRSADQLLRAVFEALREMDGATLTKAKRLVADFGPTSAKPLRAEPTDNVIRLADRPPSGQRQLAAGEAESPAESPDVEEDAGIPGFLNRTGADVSTADSMEGRHDELQ